MWYDSFGGVDPPGANRSRYLNNHIQESERIETEYTKSKNCSTGKHDKCPGRTTGLGNFDLVCTCPHHAFAQMQVLAEKAVKREGRIAMGISWFASEEEAAAYAKAVVDAGITYNGGYYDGQPCGRSRAFDYTDQDGRKLYAVTD